MPINNYIKVIGGVGATLLLLGGLARRVDYCEYERPYENARPVEVNFRPGVAWGNFQNEPLTHTADGWTQHQMQLEKANGGKLLGKFGNGDRIVLLDIPDPQTGISDGRVLPENYPK
jgi:hypothetical protein